MVHSDATEESVVIRPVAIAAGVLLLLLVALAAFAMNAPKVIAPDSDAVPTAVPSDKEVRSIEDPQWIVRAAAEPTTVEFRSTAASDRGSEDEDRVISRFDSLGPLPDGERDALIARYRRVAQSTFSRLERVRNNAGSGPSGEKTLRDLVEELEVYLMFKRQEAKIAALERGDYITVEKSDVPKLRWPPYTMTSNSTTRYRVDGKAVAVVIGIAPDDPIVRAAYEDVRMFQRMAVEEDIAAYNALSYEERRQRFEAHQAAVAAMVAVPHELPEEERRVRLAELVEQMLPSTWVVEPGSYYARVRED